MTQANRYRINRCDVDDSLIGVLAAIEEYLGGEVQVSDEAVIACTTERATAIVALLLGLGKAQLIQPSTAPVEIAAQPDEPPVSLSDQPVPDEPAATEHPHHDLSGPDLEPVAVTANPEPSAESEAKDERRCAVCGDFLTGMRADAKTCRSSVCRSAYRRNLKKLARPASSEPTDAPAEYPGRPVPIDDRDDDPILEVGTETFHSRHALLADVRAGKYPVGKLFRKSGNRIYRVEQIGQRFKLCPYAPMVGEL